MTTTIETGTVPAFRTHSRMLATFRALAIVAFCAALTALFLIEVWHAPSPRQLDGGTPVAAAHAS